MACTGKQDLKPVTANRHKVPETGTAEDNGSAITTAF
jgi:hypothetical protein